MGTPIDTYNKIITTVNSVTSDYTFEVDPENLIVIDTSNNRIGIDTVNPQRSIHISGGQLDNTKGIISPYIHLISGEFSIERTYGGNFKGSIIPDISFENIGPSNEKFYRTTQKNVTTEISGYTLGSETHRWAEIWCVSGDFKHGNFGPDSIYMEGKKIIGKNFSNGNIVIGNNTQQVELETTFTDISLTGSVNLITNTGTSYINSTGNIVIDPSGVGDKTGIVTINGDLVILGEQNIINSNIVEISDNIIKLNKNYQSNFHSNFESGIIIEDGSSNNPQLVWVNHENIWKFIRNNSNQLLDLKLSNLNITTFINFFNNNLLTAKISSQKNNSIDTLILEATNVEISNNSALIIPVGTTAQRNNPARLGSIRFNINDVAFEGYDGNAWGTLGGVKNVEKTTFIRAETSPSSGNNELDFFTNNTQRMQIGNTGIFKFGSSMSDTTLEINNTQLTSKNIIPKINHTYNIGSTSLKWNNIYARNLESTTVNATTSITTPTVSSSNINTTNINATNSISANSITTPTVNATSSITTPTVSATTINASNSITTNTFYGFLNGKANTAGTADTTNALQSNRDYTCNQLTASLNGKANTAGTSDLTLELDPNRNYTCNQLTASLNGNLHGNALTSSSCTGNALTSSSCTGHADTCNLANASKSTNALLTGTYGNYECNTLTAVAVYGGILFTQTQSSQTSGSYYSAYFTGSHGNNNNFNFNVIIDYNGLIVSCIDKYVNINHSIRPTISESLPVTKLTNIEKDKAVFGVIAHQEFMKESINKFKVNSLGEGAMWITNKNGNLEIGDYITSSIIPGYGQKQNDDLLHNYTVAKITCNCDFSLEKKIKQKIITISNENYSDKEYKQFNEAYETLHKEFISYDENGEIQYEDELDLSGNQIYEYKFDTRFLDESGNILNSLADYLIKLNNGENVYIACFVGCTYHCA